jgi:SAM-dependent methyltransferase
MKSAQEHWNSVYSAGRLDQLGWYEAEPSLSLQLIENCSIDQDDAIMDVGAGSTTLVDYLLQRDYGRIIALDVSKVALGRLRRRLSPAQASRVKWLVGDITNPAAVKGLKDIAIWHDRALLHFLIEEDGRQAYLSALKKAVRPGGYVIIAAFARDGASKCSGLDVKRYDSESLADFLGDEFAVLESTSYCYRMPSGAIRPYVYARFQRVRQADGFDIMSQGSPTN